MPNARFGKIHVYNNYYSCTGNNYCARARFEAEILSEYNYYDEVRNPLLAEDGGFAKSIGNIYYKCTNEIYPGKDSIFSPDYSYDLISAECAKWESMAMAGNIPRNKIFEAKISKIDTIMSEHVENEPISEVQYKWIAADSIDIKGLPDGVTYEKDFKNQVLTLNGSPAESGSFILKIQSYGCAQSITLTDTLTIKEKVGINKINFADHLTLYPNPSGNETFFSLNNYDEIQSVSIYQLNGKMLFYKTNNSGKEICVNHSLSPGIYLVIVNGLKGIYHTKLIVE